MARKRNMLREAEKYAQFLLWEATGGSMGREPVKGKDKKEDEFKVDFGTKRALLDSMIKLIGIKQKVDPEEEDEDGIASYKELLNAGSGESIERRTSEPPAVNGSPPTSAVHGNGRVADFLE